MKENRPSTENLTKDGDKKRKAKSYPKDLTVEQYLNQHCDQLVQSLQEHASSLAKQLKGEYDELKQLLQSETERKKKLETASSSTDKNLASVKVNLAVEEGPYKGRKFDVEVFADKPSFLGRSRGVKFRHGGISLPRDGEVSTTHGKFELDLEKPSGEQLVFTDVGSTNGTFINEEEVSANMRTYIQEGDVMLVGATLMKVSNLVYSS
mmetsp:Transcript_73/g.55  ORF Transcript_73/g.55 Transcript_73/m.55 type:complete len:208 (+) Transcript_73:210-833(+)|eukprot:CAMPEP_0184036424 /NCGR_PEP_ID=MMETSP0955-20130417/32468_1 /TAXON_ID=627963 /ORGANISM="Aplanochytrium sp, Strain PBS07" /LENGTH=207 /DNA_ID=CAMNT_0026324077 /DNA_START=128 /DNA_END=751 /DNA_ORIENTATION=+